MTHEQFMNEVDAAHLRSRRILERKAPEYTFGQDRLDSFKRMGAMEDKNYTEVLFTLMNKHVSSIAIMSKSPHSYTKKQWRAKLDDLRNYAHLQDSLLTDIGIE